MRLSVIIAFVATFFGLVSSLAIPGPQDLVPRARTNSRSRSRGHSKSPSPGPHRPPGLNRNKSPSPGPSHGPNKSPTPGPSHGPNSSPKPVAVKLAGHAMGSIKRYKIPQGSPEQAAIINWHIAAVRAHAAINHPTATEIRINKLVHAYGSKDNRLHISYEVKGPAKWIQNDGSYKNNRWHHAPVDESDVPQAYRAAVEAKGHTL
jgi:hypothetical protein